MFLFLPTMNEHIYTFACQGLKKVRNKTFLTRQEANSYMYRMCNKYGVDIKEVWNDHHDVTFVGTNGVKFFIHRA